MQFRLKNISNQNHRVEMHSTNMDTFNQNGPEPGDVVLENGNHSFNACLAGLAGPLITCAGSLPTAGFRVANAFDGLFYLNGIEYDFNVPGETFLDKYRNLAENNLDFDMLLEVTEINENPNEVMFTAASPEPVRVAIVANNAGVVNWQQQPSETVVNETIEITDSQITFCLMGRWSFDINKPNSLFIDNQNYISLQMFPDNPILLDETNVQLTIVAGEAEIAIDSLSENYASWSVKAKSSGKLHFQLWCPFLIPEHQLFEIDASEMPVMELATPGLFDWNIRSQSASLSAINQSFNDGLIIPATQMQYQVTAKTTYPPYYSDAVNLISKELLFSAIGSSELVGRAYHPAVGQVLDSTSKLINVFGVPDAVNLGLLEPGSSTVVKIALEGIAELPDGWTTQLTKRSPISTDISTMANWSIDPIDPTLVTVNVVGGDYTNNIILGLDYFDPAGNPTITTEINFRINTGFTASQTIFATYPNDDSTSKEVDLKGIVYGSKIGGNVTIKAFDFEMDLEPVNTYQTTIDSKGQFNFRLPETAFSVDARRPTIQVLSESWSGDVISSMHYAKPRLPLIVKCERNVPLRFDRTSSRTVNLMIDVDGEKKVYPNSVGTTSLDLTSIKTDLATLKIYAENPWKGTNNLGIRFYRLKDGTNADVDDVNPSIREIVSFGTLIDSSEVASLRFDSMSGLTIVPNNIPADWQSTESLFAGCKDLNDPNIQQWNVTGVKQMQNMFNKCTAFNQDLSGWCVTNISSEPTGFATDSGLTPAFKPVWGTCPNG